MGLLIHKDIGSQLCERGGISERMMYARMRDNWNEQVNKILNERDVTWHDAREVAMDRRLWAEFIHS